MVEPLKKDDIKKPITLDIFSKNEYVEVSRIKEIVKDIISFSCTTNSRTELQCKIINRFGVLFDNNLKDVPEANDQTSIDDSGVVGKTGKPPQSPKRLETPAFGDKDKPSQVVVSESPSERVSKNPVGVSSLFKITRVELITQKGRQYVTWKAKNVQVSIQDNERTLKVFLEDEK